MNKLLLLVLTVILTSQEWIILGDSAFQLGYKDYAKMCWYRATLVSTKEAIK